MPTGGQTHSEQCCVEKLRGTDDTEGGGTGRKARC